MSGAQLLSAHLLLLLLLLETLSTVSRSLGKGQANFVAAC